MRAFLLLVSLASCLAWTPLEQKVVDAFKTARENMLTKDIIIGAFLPDKGEKVESQKASPDSQLEQIRGDLLLEVTKILVKENGVEILPQLETIDVENLLEESMQFARKKRAVTATSCAPESKNCNRQKNFEERSITGVCNNVGRKENGAALTFFRRLKGRAHYGDGFGSVNTKSVTNSPLPSPRLVSNKLSAEIAATKAREQPGGSTCGRPITIKGGDTCFAISRDNGLTLDELLEFNLGVNCGNLQIGAELCLEKPQLEIAKDLTTSHYHMQYGQFIAHDIVITPESVGPSGETLECESCSSSDVTDNCSPIEVPADDEYFPPNSCIRLTRALNGQKGLGQRQQLNQNTHYLDLSALYGSEECEAASVRTFQDGQLKTFDAGHLLPPQDKNDSNCQSTSPNYCFLCGDVRNSIQPALLTLHNVYVKEHNRIARAFKSAKRTWSDEKIFQETRRIVIAQYVHHVYSDYLPRIIGDATMKEFDLYPLATGYYRGYDETVIGSASIEFCVAALRFGHTQIPKDIKRVKNNNQTLAAPIDLGSHIFYTEPVYDQATGGTESILDGLCQHAAEQVDFNFSFPIRNQIFEIREQKASGIDLIATNMMRGREVGLFPYNQYREVAGRPKAATFDDLIADMGVANVEALKKVYAHVDDIDLYPGMLLETPLPGAKLGRVGTYIIAETFSALKKGDRFYYENLVIGTRGLTPDELTAVRNSRLEKVACDSSSVMEMINENIFDHGGPRIRCDSMSPIDLRPFLNNGINPYF